MSRDSETISAKRPRPVLTVIVVSAVLALCAAGIWLFPDLSSGPVVYVVGDSITSLSRTAISGALTKAGYRPTIGSTPGVKIGQALHEVTTLSSSEPWAWVIELGTDDAGANDRTWVEPFLAEWSLISAASCVIYVTISPRAGPVGIQINAAIENLARVHSNVHVLDWGNTEYSNPAWVTFDGIHPTPQGEIALANLETQALQACRSH